MFIKTLNILLKSGKSKADELYKKIDYSDLNYEQSLAYAKGYAQALDDLKKKITDLKEIK